MLDVKAPQPADARPPGCPSRHPRPLHTHESPLQCLLRVITAMFTPGSPPLRRPYWTTSQPGPERRPPSLRRRLPAPRTAATLCPPTVQRLDGPVDPGLVLAVDESISSPFDEHVCGTHTLFGEELSQSPFVNVCRKVSHVQFGHHCDWAGWGWHTEGGWWGIFHWLGYCR